MAEVVIFETEQRLERSEIATHLRRVADSLDAGEDLAFAAGEESVTLSPPERPTFEVTAEREGPADGPGELSVEFELEWDENADNSGDFRVE
jgi:amphi-Trp domain-containing protein